MLSIPHCLDNRLIDGGKIVSPKHQPQFTPQKHFFPLLVLISLKRLNKPQGLVRPGYLGKLKKFIHLIGSRTRDLHAASSIVPQPLCHLLGTNFEFENEGSAFIW
jgi:hypothetical protein